MLATVTLVTRPSESIFYIVELSTELMKLTSLGLSLLTLQLLVCGRFLVVNDGRVKAIPKYASLDWLAALYLSG